MKQVMTALITPFHEDGSVDFGSLRALVHDQLEVGIDGFIVCGTTGETPTLTMEEKEAVIDCVLHECGGRVPVYAGAGTNCTATTIAAICRLEKYPLTGYLLVTPYYSRPSEEGLFRHFQAACALTHKPVMLYHVPKRTASRISVALLHALLKACPNIRAVKYADRCYEEVLALCKPYREKMDSVTHTITAMQAAGTLSPDKLDSLRQLFLPVYEEMKGVKKDFLRRHADEDIAVYLLADLGRESGDMLSLIGEKTRKGPLASLYQAMEEALARQKAVEEARKNMVEGAEAPDFTLKDLSGNDFSLSSLRGKYVVLDFWGSWCGWCIKGIPDMKKYYTKYKDRMEIVGVDCRDTEEKWKAAVEKYELPWLHVRNTDEADITVKYGIQGYPTKIVVDPEGRVAKIVVGEDPAFYKYLDELFK